MVSPESAQKRDLQVSHRRTTCFATPRTCRICRCSSSVLHAFPTALLAVLKSKVYLFQLICQVGAWNRGIRVNFDQSADLADPTPTKKRRQRGTYTHYKAKDRAKIGKYALENGNTSTRCHFSAEFPDLKESTIRNFKKVYKEHLGYQRKQLHPKAVTEIPSQPRGRPPLLLEIDTKLLSFLKAVRRRGGVVNSHVVHAAAKALIDTAGSETTKQQLSKIDLPRSWVQSIYRRMGLIRRMATTSRPPVPQGLYDECRNHYLREVDETIKKCYTTRACAEF